MLTFGCNKPNAPDCIKKGGDEIVAVRNFSNNINKLILYDYIQIELIPSDENYLEIVAPENLIPGILTKESGTNTLEISNENTCNFVRSFKRKVTVKIHMNIIEIESYSSGNIKTNQTLDQAYFSIDCFGSSGRVDLYVDCDSLNISIHDGLSDVFLTGNSELTYLYNAGINSLDASLLQSNNTFVNSSSINNIYITANDYLFASINSSGSVYYSGSPTDIDFLDNGSGELIGQ